LIGGRRFAESLLGSSSFIGKVHHGPVMIGRRAAPNPAPSASRP
jgi:hypothetical protein